MDILQAFVLDGTTHSVTILWENERPLFRASEIGNIIDIKNVRSSIKNFDADEKVVQVVDTNGGERENIFLTEHGVYRMLMLSRKPVARPFQKWVAHVITTIREKGKYELDTKIKSVMEEEAHKRKEGIAQGHHDALVSAFKGPDRYVVYFGKVRNTNDGNTLIKIGSSKDVKERMEKLPREFGSMQFFHIMDCPMNEAFEKFLHRHASIRPLLFREEVTPDHISTEVFKMTQKQIDKAIRIAVRNLHKFSSRASAEQMLEMQKIRLEKAKVHLEIAKVKAGCYKNDKHESSDEVKNEEVSESDSDEDTEIDPTILYADNRKYTQVRGNKVQCYSADGKTLLKTYIGHTEAIRTMVLEDPSPSRIRAAIESKTIYRGYRWASLDRSLPDDTFQDIGETVASVEIRKGYVAMLNLTKTKIEKVYCDQKAAKDDRMLKTVSAISTALKLERKCSGHYFRMWNDCTEELQKEYLAHNELPAKRVSSISRAIEKLHPISGIVIQKYDSIVDVVHDMRISRLNLQNAAESGYIAKGYKWRFV